MTSRILLVLSLAFGAFGWFDLSKLVQGSVNQMNQAGGERAASTEPTATALESKIVLGPTVVATVADSGLTFLARVDTGARTCSIHAEEITIKDASSTMVENIGKTVRFRTVNGEGQSAWLERPIQDVRWIKTSEKGEWRYVVPLTLSCEGTCREVLVSLNQRDHMDHALLVGRNLLAGAFLVDVAR